MLGCLKYFVRNFRYRMYIDKREIKKVIYRMKRGMVVGLFMWMYRDNEGIGWFIKLFNIIFIIVKMLYKRKFSILILLFIIFIFNLGVFLYGRFILLDMWRGGRLMS